MSEIVDALDNDVSDPSKLTRLESDYSWGAENFQPWIGHGIESLSTQRSLRSLLRRRAGAERLSENCFISTAAQIHTEYLSMGDNSWIAAGAIVRGHVTIGANSSINPYTHVAGRVVIGNGVRIAGQVSIYGFNHGFDREDVPIYAQAHTSKGILIGDGTWIGANAVIIDGVTVGEHCIIAAGAVVTKSVPDYSIVGGNPASIIRNRKSPSEALALQVPKPSARVRSLLYANDPYIDLPFSYPPDLQGWDSEHPIFAETIAAVRPKLIVEVGTWKGASAIHMAKTCRDLGVEAEIVCVDTWLGNWQHWSRGAGGVGSREDLKIVNGFPRLYYQFLSNVIHRGFQDVITPLPLTGVAGAKLFEHFNVTPEMVYVDGDHEYESVLFDLRLWLKQLAPAGVLVGDDYTWPTVKQAVDEVVAAEGLVFQSFGNKFALRRVGDEHKR